VCVRVCVNVCVHVWECVCGCVCEWVHEKRRGMKRAHTHTQNRCTHAIAGAYIQTHNYTYIYLDRFDRKDQHRRLDDIKQRKAKDKDVGIFKGLQGGFIHVLDERLHQEEGEGDEPQRCQLLCVYVYVYKYVCAIMCVFMCVCMQMQVCICE
jgi:hypothetical protein